MEIVEGSSSRPVEFPSPVVTIGNFDGVHIGHQKIFQIVTDRARKRGGTSVCYTFLPHPQKIIAPERCPPLLVTRRKKFELIAAQGIDVLVEEPFTREFSQQTAAEFMKNVLYAAIHPAEVYVGHDFHFGKGREASFAVMQGMGEDLGFSVNVIDEVMSNNEEVSSSRIRRLVGEGRVEEAAVLLGRAFTAEGTVVTGAARGRALGFATANIDVKNEILPADGVYAVFGRLGDLPGDLPPSGGAHSLADRELLPGVANLGFAPTFGRDRRTLEVHFLDVEGDRYGSHVELLFLARLRGERKFPAPDALAAQIRKDVLAARKVQAGNAWRLGRE